jgi:hypothetical protein
MRPVSFGSILRNKEILNRILLGIEIRIPRLDILTQTLEKKLAVPKADITTFGKTFSCIRKCQKY